MASLSTDWTSCTDSYMCDFTSCFFRKGKVKPFQQLETDAQKQVMALQFLTSVEVDIPAVTSFICTLWVQNCQYK